MIFNIDHCIFSTLTQFATYIFSNHVILTPHWIFDIFISFDFIISLMMVFLTDDNYNVRCLQSFQYIVYVNVLNVCSVDKFPIQFKSIISNDNFIKVNNE